MPERARSGIDQLLDLHDIEGWKPIADATGILYRIRSVSGALVSLCVIHDEKSPSLWMRESNKFNCYGCGTNGTRSDYILAQSTVAPSEVLRRLGINEEEVADPNLDDSFFESLYEKLDRVDLMLAREVMKEAGIAIEEPF
ncbi:hypothetical protein KC950_01715 [Candidatus Saccharibacteria bacterium]|nr:hypothetical protein [Candidatus Saccharibacteria bacterium]